MIATDNNKDTRPPKQQRLPAVSCRYSSPASIVSKLQGDRTDQTQSFIAGAAVLQQSDLRSSYNYYQESIAESNNDYSRSLINSKLSDTASSVTAILRSSNIGDAQPSDL